MSKITVNEQAGRFDWDLNGQTAFLLFHPVDEHTWSYTYVFVPPELRGREYAARLTRHALEYARERGKKVTPVCPYIRAFVTKNKSEFDSMLEER